MRRYKRHKDAACTVVRIGSKQADASLCVGIAYPFVIGIRERACRRRWGEYDNVFPVWRFFVSLEALQIMFLDSGVSGRGESRP